MGLKANTGTSRLLDRKMEREGVSSPKVRGPFHTGGASVPPSEFVVAGDDSDDPLRHFVGLISFRFFFCPSFGPPRALTFVPAPQAAALQHALAFFAAASRRVRI
jgi:hypothetical protein